MSYDFSAQGRSARALIDVPDAPIASIRARAHASRAQGRMRIAAACAALFVAVTVGAATGAGAKLYSTVRVWIAGADASITVSTVDVVRQPTSAELRDAIAHATFPVVLPTGFPPGTRLTSIYSTPAGHPSALVISYANKSTGMVDGFVLADPAVVDRSGDLLKMQGITSREMYNWRAGQEIVLVPKQLPAADAERIKAAMQSATPADSLAATEPMLPTITVLGEMGRLDVAERLRPQTGRSVLIDHNQVRSVAALAREDAPLRDMRVFHVTEFPYVNGQPDYPHVKGWNARTVAVPPGGVRAIDAVLRSAGAEGAKGDCGCEVLINQPSPAAYTIWMIPLSSSAEVRKYAVDAGTLAVTEQPL